jgi:hypothetical protein
MTNVIFSKVEYETAAFDLTVPQAAFKFIFQLYNFLSASKADNDGFHEPARRLVDAKDSIARRGYPTLNNTKRKRDETTKHDSEHSRGPPASGGARDCFDNSSVQKVLTRAGYTLTRPISEDLTLLTPVSCDSRRCAR